jgi:hypothetical protein
MRGAPQLSFSISFALTLLLSTLGISACLCQPEVPPPPLIPTDTPAGSESPASPIAAPAPAGGATSALSPRARNATPGPWVARAIIVGGKAYVLRHQMDEDRPPSNAEHIELYEARALMRATAELPIERPQELTLIGREGSCVVQATQVARVFLGCENPPENPGDTPPVEYTGRRALVTSVCPALAPTEGWSLVWAVDGSHEDVQLQSSRLELPEDRRHELDQRVRPYIRARTLTEWLPERWSVDQVNQIPGLAPQLVVVGGERDSLTLLVHGERVLSHLEPGLAPLDYFQIGNRTYLHIITRRECHYVHMAQNAELIPVYQDCLNLFCGDGLL